jgi:hypothetical protein
LIDKTNPNHVDYQNLVKTKAKIEKIVSMINEQKRKFDFEQASKKIDKILLDEDLKIENREFRLESYAFVQTKDQSAKKMVLFLYRDLIIFSSILEKSTSVVSKLSFFGKKPASGKGEITKTNSFTKFTTGGSSKSRSSYYDEKTGDTLVFHSFYYLKDCKIEVGELEEIDLIYCDETEDDLKFSIEIIENPHENKKQKWRDELTRFIKEAHESEDLEENQQVNKL